MPIVQLTPKGRYSTLAGTLGGISDLLSTFFQTREMVKEQERLKEERKRAQEIDDFNAQAKLREVAMAEAQMPEFGDRPTVAEGGVIPVETRTGGALAEMPTIGPPKVDTITGQPITPQTPATPLKTSTGEMTTPAPAQIEYEDIPALMFRGQEVVKARKVPKLYLAEVQRAEAQKKREEAIAGGAVEVTPEVAEMLPPAVAALYPVGSVIPPTVSAAAVREGSKPEVKTKSPWTAPFTGPDDVSYQRNDETGEIRRTPGVGRKPAAPGPTSSPATPVVAGLTGKEMLDALRKAGQGPLADQIAAIAEGRKNIQQIASLRKPKGDTESERMALDRLVTQYDPTWDATVWRSRNATREAYSNPSRPAGRQIQSVNTLVKHLRTLKDRADKMNNTQFRLFNKAWVAGKRHVGDPTVQEFLAAAEAAAGELATIYKGGGAAPTQTEIAAQRSIFDPVNSPDQLTGAINTSAELMAGRLSTLEEEWERVMGSRPEKPFVNASARKALQSLGLTHLLPQPGGPEGLDIVGPMITVEEGR